MKFIGLDLGGVNSLACIREDGKPDRLQGSAFPCRPSVVLFPIVRKERVLAGDEALQNERGSGLVWPPIASAASNGWSRPAPPIDGGRVLLASVWQCLTEGGRWSEPQWQPPDGLPPINKPTPADSIAAEVSSLCLRTLGREDSDSVVLAIPNQLPEESQDALLIRLPQGVRLVWRSVAAAIAWAQENAEHIRSDTQLTVVDAGVYGLEISVFDFHRQEKVGRAFQVPVRRLSRLHTVKTDSLLSDSPAPFSALQPDVTRIDSCLSEISQAITPRAALLFCGPLGTTLVDAHNRLFPHVAWPAPNGQVVARGSALFASRLAEGLPTYLDVLQSLELFTLTEEHEPNWLVLIPPDSQVAGGEDFDRMLSRRAFIEQGASRLSSWLQRSGEREFRKLTTDLPVKAAQNAWMDLRVTARSAGGFARLLMVPSANEFEIFGPGQGILLNWQGMERVLKGPKQRWPVEIKYGWPACGKLYAHRPFFEEFLAAVEREGTKPLDHRMINHRMASLGILKSHIAKTIAPHLAGVKEEVGDAAPVNLLVCFSTAAPCEFLETTVAGSPRITTSLPRKDAEVRRIAHLFWQRLKALQDAKAAPAEINALLYILGRFGGYAPQQFRDHLAHKLYPTSKRDFLFAAGRVLESAEHGQRLFSTLDDKFTLCQSLNNNWLRMLVYVLYQSPEVLREVPRGLLLSAVRLCLDAFDQQVQRGRQFQKVRPLLFMNSLRALALILRARRTAGARDFLCANRCSPDEAQVALRFRRLLGHATRLPLRPAAATLVKLVIEWLDFVASTDEMPPIAPPNEDDEEEDDD